MGRSRLIAASPMVRDSELEVDAPSRDLVESRWTVLPATVRVVLASPAGSLKILLLAVAFRSADAVVDRERSVGNAGSSRSLRVRLTSRSALLVTVQRHCDLVVPLRTPPRCALFELVL